MSLQIHRQEVDGAVCLTLPDPSFGLVRFVVTLRLGAILDPPEQIGAMRLMGEMLLRGTQQRSRMQFGRALEELGAQVDVSVSHEMALCRGVCLTRHLPQVWELVTEALCSPALDAAELERLRTECLDELLGERDDDDAVAEIFLRRALFAGHRLAERSGGSAATLQRLQVADLRAAHARFCAYPKVVAWAGMITPADAEARTASLQRSLAAVAAPGIAAALPPPPAPRQTPKIILVDKPDRSQVQLRLASLGPVGDVAACEAFWLAVLAFGGTFTSPFTRQVRDLRGWSYVAHADCRRQARLATPLTLRCAPALGDAANCLTLCRALYGELARGELDTQVIESARQYVANRFPFEVATVFDMLGGALAQELCGLPPGHLHGLPERLAAQSAERVRAAAAGQLSPEGYVALVVAPRASLHAQLVAQVADVEVVDYRDGAAPPAG